MGGRSSSSSSSSTTNYTETGQVSSEGVVTGDQILGAGDVSIVNELPDEVSNLFGKLIDLTSETTKLAADAGGQALDAVSTRFERAEQPQTSVVRDFLPLFVIVAGVLAGIVVYRKG